MKTSLFVALCFNALLIGRVVSLSCGSAQCGSSDACCNDSNLGPRCYDPSTYDCVDGSHLCGKGLEACGSACYNPSQYSCSNGHLTQGGSSPTQSPTQPPTQSPTQAPSSCGSGLQSCGSACYDPASYSCAPDGTLYLGGTAPALFCSPFELNPCAHGQECCEDVCFDASVQNCLNGQLCAKGQSLCGYDLCYDASTHECCNENIYEKGTSICSQSDASCCSCTCSQETYSESYTLPSGQCHPQYIVDNFGYLPCVNDNYGGACGENCVESCGPYPTIANYCFSDAESGCTGHFICGGGNFTCSATSHSQCATPAVKNTATTTTQVSSGSPNFQALSPNYVGEVCCYCVGDDHEWSESLPVPSYNDCQSPYVNITNAPYHCRVWSPFSSAYSFCSGPGI